MTRDIDVFLCYRRAGAQTAKLFKRYLSETKPYLSVWYSDLEPVGNFKADPQGLLASAQCAVLFIDESFVTNFDADDDEVECITALEIAEMEKKLQSSSDFRIVTVFLDRGGFTPQESDTLHRLFQRHHILTVQSVSHFSQSNVVPFSTSKDSEELLFASISENFLPETFYKKRKQKGNFYFGKYQTSVDIIAWNIEQGICPENIQFLESQTEIDEYNAIESKRTEVDFESQNNQMVSLCDVCCALSDDHENMNLTISYKQIDYHLFQKTLALIENCSMNLNQLIAEYSFINNEAPVYKVPNAMGLAFMVVTSDQKLMFSKRSERRRVRARQYDCSIVEGLKVINEGYCIDDPIYVRNEIVRAYKEEVSADIEQIKSILITGLVLDKEFGQWNLIGTVFTNETAQEISQRHSIREDTYEDTLIEFVPYTNAVGELSLEELQNCLLVFRQAGFWGMGLAATYATLRILGFSDSEIERETLL